MSSAGAKRGFSRETIFVNLIKNQPVFRKNLNAALTKLKLINNDDNIISAVDVKKRCKSDVIIKLGTAEELGCSLKAAEADFNQLDRRWLAGWAEVLEMPQSILNMFQSSLDRKIIKSRDVFILPTEEKHILPFLETKKATILRELFTREDENLKAFVTYDEISSKWRVARIEDIVSALMKEPITVSKKGVIYIGDCLSLQRKGGDGNVTVPPKTSPRHPSNQLQFKIKPLKVINKVPFFEVSE